MARIAIPSATQKGAIRNAGTQCAVQGMYRTSGTWQITIIAIVVQNHLCFFNSQRTLVTSTIVKAPNHAARPLPGSRRKLNRKKSGEVTTTANTTDASEIRLEACSVICGVGWCHSIIHKQVVQRVEFRVCCGQSVNYSSVIRLVEELMVAAQCWNGWQHSTVIASEIPDDSLFPTV